MNASDMSPDRDDSAPPARSNREGLRDLVANASVMVCCGSGGVGKTTTAAVLAMEAARIGRRSVVVTIDPAKRLADALGLDGLGNEAHAVSGEWPGSMSALMLDTNATFDDLVAQYAGSSEQAAKILANRFYRNIAGALSGTQEYMATEKLYALHNSDEFDIVIVDTPPTRNALDFLDAPGRLTRFLDHRLYRLVTAPGRGVVRAVGVATQRFLRSAGKVVGGEVIADAIAFFQAFDGMEEGFKDRARAVDRLLSDPGTAFVLVASAKRDTVQEAEFFADRLRDSRIDVRALILNRMHPQFGDGEPDADVEESIRTAGSEWALLHTNRAQLNAIARSERTQVAGLLDAVSSAIVVDVPLLPFDVHDIATLDQLAGELFGRTR